MNIRNTRKPLSRIVALSALVLSNTSVLADGLILDEIIVTAQKRSQGLQDVPISLNAVPSEKIEGYNITSLGDLSSSVPNLQITKTGVTNQIGMRGVFSGANKGFEQSVAMYVDEVYYGRGQLIQLPLLDLERVEVLRGPQPTLFGKNAIAGAISLTSARPTDDLQASISTLYEVEHQESKTQGMLSGPITEQLRGRLVALYRELDGWIDNITLNQKEPNVEQSYARGMLEWDNDNNLRTTLKVETATFDTNGRSIENFSPVGNFNTVFTGPLAVETNLDYQREDNGSVSQNDVDTVVFSVDYNINDHTITSTTAFLQYTTSEQQDIDFTALNLFDGSSQSEDFEQFSQELRIVSPIGVNYDYIAGIYFQSSELIAADDVLFGQGFNNVGLAPLAGGNWDRDFSQNSDVISAFIQYALHINDELTLTAGGRYSYEEKDATRVLILNGANTAGNQAGFENALGLLGVAAHNVAGSRDESQFDPIVNLQYILNEDIMIYASYTQGSKGGGYDIRSNNAPNAPVNPGSFEFQDENATSYEAGTKVAFDRGEINLAAFFTEYKNLQVTQFDGQIGFNVQNAAEAEISGLELDGRYLLMENLVLTGSIGFLNYEYQDYDVAQCASPLVIVQPPSQTNPLLCNFNGMTGANAPESTANLALEYQHNVGEWAIMSYGLNIDYSDEYFASSTLDPNTLQDAYVKLGARVALAGEEDTWRVALIGNNLTDERILTNANTLPLSTNITNGNGVAYYGIYERPRNIALELGYTF